MTGVVGSSTSFTTRGNGKVSAPVVLSSTLVARRPDAAGGRGKDVMVREEFEVDGAGSSAFGTGLDVVEEPAEAIG